MLSGSGERKLWIAAGLWLAAIYVSAYQARTVAEALRSRGLLSVAVAFAFVVVAVLVLFWAVRRRPSAATFGILALAAVFLGLCLTRIPSPEEKIHFIEYGVLAGLIRAAMAPRSVWLRVAAILFTALAGLGDEVIQRYIPNRVFDWRDVAVNATAGALVVVTVELLGLSERRERGRTARD